MEKQVTLKRLSMCILSFILLLVIVPTLGICTSPVLITREKLRQLLTHAMETSPTLKDVHIELEETMIPPQLSLPAGKLDISLESKLNSHSSYVTLAATLMVDDLPTRRFIVRGRILGKQKYLIFTRNIHRGEIISQRDIKFAFAPQESMNEKLSIADVCGMQLSRDVNAGQPVAKRFLQQPVLVKRGDMVVITYKKGGVHIIALGKALKNGSKCEIIPVTNVDSNKVIYAEVIAQKKVSVNYHEKEI